MNLFTKTKYSFAQLGLLLLCGCGEAAPELLMTVTCQGEPLKTGRVVFHPSQGRDARAKIKDGQVVDITTHQKGDGLLTGTYKVGIYSFVRQPMGMEVVPSVIDKKYNRVETSGIELDLEPGINEVAFDLEPVK